MTSTSTTPTTSSTEASTTRRCRIFNSPTCHPGRSFPCFPMSCPLDKARASSTPPNPIVYPNRNKHWFALLHLSLPLFHPNLLLYKILNSNRHRHSHTHSHTPTYHTHTHT